TKSDENPNAYISVLDEPDVIMKKIKRAVTDSDREIRYSEEKAGIRNLLDIYSVMTGIDVTKAVANFEGKGYGDLKKAVGEAVVEGLRPLQTKYKELSKDKAYINEIIKTNAEKASYLANKTLRKVKKKVGFPQ
ncbi:MAG: tryptophan--tRNA ligase, partial [Eubacteriales bacterium]